MSSYLPQYDQVRSLAGPGTQLGYDTLLAEDVVPPVDLGYPGTSPSGRKDVVECPSGRVQEVVQPPVRMDSVVSEGWPLVPVGDDLQHGAVALPLVHRLPQRPSLETNHYRQSVQNIDKPECEG